MPEPLYQNEVRCSAFLVEMSFICVRMAEFTLETSYPSRRIIRQTENSSKYKSEDEFCSIDCLDILSGKQETLRKYRNQSLSCGNFVKKPSTLRIIRLRRIIRLLARLQNVLTDESASDEFCSIIRL